MNPIFAAVLMAAALTSSKEVEAVLDQFHHAAAKADANGYFSLFAPEGVFLGTDAAERWTVDEFKKYAAPHFSKGKGWTYAPKTRHVDFTPDGSVAWFDEILDNDGLGTCRGSGVLRKIDGAWKISQYNLSIPIPNELAKQIAATIRAKKP